MATPDVLPGKQDDPWHLKVWIDKQCGAIEFVDEYGTPFWSKTDYVLLEPSHPIFNATNPSGALEDLHQEYWQQLQWAGSDATLKNQPIKASKDAYEAAKLIFRNVN